MMAWVGQTSMQAWQLPQCALTGSLGSMLLTWEYAVAVAGRLLGINPFDQFGVELGKDIARGLGDAAGRGSLDPSTGALMERAGV